MMTLGKYDDSAIQFVDKYIFLRYSCRLLARYPWIYFAHSHLKWINIRARW